MASYVIKIGDRYIRIGETTADLCAKQADAYRWKTRVGADLSARSWSRMADQEARVVRLVKKAKA